MVEKKLLENKTDVFLIVTQDLIFKEDDVTITELGGVEISPINLFQSSNDISVEEIKKSNAYFAKYGAE